MHYQNITKLLLVILLQSSIIFQVEANMNLTPEQTREKFTKIANAYEKAYFERHPELALYWGYADVVQDRFMDRSQEGLLAWQKAEDKFLADLNELEPHKLTSRADYKTYQLLKEMLESDKNIRVCRDELWNVSPMVRGALHNVLSYVAEKQPVGTEEYRRLALTRWQTVNTLVEDEIRNLRLGLKEGYSAPKVAVERAVKQLKIILNTPIEQSPFFVLAKRDDDVKFKKQIAKLIENEINPALKKYADFLEKDYYQKARDKIGVSENPNGVQCYQAKIRKNTTLNISPEEIYQFGVTHMETLYKEVAEIGIREFGISDMSSVYKEAKNRTKRFFNTEEDIVKYNELALERAKIKAPLWFNKIPEAPGLIKPYPLHRAQTGAPGEYHPPSKELLRPGIFYINTYEPQNKNRVDQEAVLFHELIPGHHFQFSLAMEDTSTNPLDKYIWNSAFLEGWALYTERLADEMGLYSDNISRIGMLSGESFRTARLVVDPGIHVMNWSRQKAKDYLLAHTAMDEHIVDAEIDRYIMMPGQATSYMLGRREIDNLRALAKVKLDDQFDIREFHDQVICNGSLTLGMLDSYIRKWIDSKKNKEH